MLTGSNNYKAVGSTDELQCIKLNQELCPDTLSATPVTEEETHWQIKFLPFRAEFNFCHFLQHFWTWVTKIKTKVIKIRSEWTWSSLTPWGPEKPLGFQLQGRTCSRSSRKWAASKRPKRRGSTSAAQVEAVQREGLRRGCTEKCLKPESFLPPPLQFPWCNWAGCYIISSRLPVPLKVGPDDLPRSLPTWAALIPWLWRETQAEAQLSLPPLHVPSRSLQEMSFRFDGRAKPHTQSVMFSAQSDPHLQFRGSEFLKAAWILKIKYVGFFYTG